MTARIIRAAILTLLLAGCASANMRETTAHGDWDRDGCIAYRCKMICSEDATPEQRAAFAAGEIDAGERKQLRRLGIWLTADAGTTIAALTLGAVVYAMARHDAARSPSWCSSARPIRIAANIRVAASISNAVTAAVCP